MKSRLGISVGLLGAIIYACGLFGGYIPLIILCGYVLLVEKNDWLEYVAVKAICVNILFSVLFLIISVIPDLLDIIQDFVYLFKGTFSYQVISNMESCVYGIISFIKNITYLLLMFKALTLGDMRIGVVDSLINKHMNGGR